MAVMEDEDRVATAVGVGDVEGAERLAGIAFTPAERALLLGRAREQLAGYGPARQAGLHNGVPPALAFDPRPPLAARPSPPPPVPDDDEPIEFAGDEDLAFLPIRRLATLLRRGEVTSMRLTELAIGRLKRYGPPLHCLVTLTEELALEQAERADEELAAGADRGVLHGIPYGVKDLLEVAGYPTTWGAEPYRGRVSDHDATVVERLRDAGAVLVAKLSLGELAMGDVWYGGMTLNPWEPSRGSSGSSAGSAAAVAAGLLPFAIGSETMGSIVSPATRCAVVGLRPSPGLVSRYGAMALSWSLDKLGPFTRDVVDAALVLAAISGPDGRDSSLFAGPFSWDPGVAASDLRIGYVAAAFEDDHPGAEASRDLLEGLRANGTELVPVTLPDFAVEPIMNVLMVEAAAAFEELTRSGDDDRLAQQGHGSWPNLFRAARLVPAVEYVQANRLRTLAVAQMRELFGSVDAYLCPLHFYRNIYLTNATGNPCVVLPQGWRAGRAVEGSMTVTGPLLGEANAIAVARLVEGLTGERPRPRLSTLGQPLHE